MLTRRRTLQLAAATAALAAAGGYTLTRRTEDLVLSVLDRHFGPVEMAPADIAGLTEAILDPRPWIEPSRKLGGVHSVAEALGLGGPLAAALPEENAATLARFERHVLGGAVQMTDVAMRPEGERRVNFVGPAACLNPFAKFG